MNSDKELLQQQIRERGIVAVLGDISEIYGDAAALILNNDNYEMDECIAAQAIAMQIRFSWEFARGFDINLSRLL